MKLKYMKLLWIIILIITLLVFLYYQNNNIMVTSYKVDSKDISKAFSGYKIVHLSDIHNKKFYKNGEDLIKKIYKEEPDLIVITGDLIDKRRYNETLSLNLLKKLIKIAPIYYVTGNHEFYSGKFIGLEKKLKELNVKVLRNERLEIRKDNKRLNILGIDDYTYFNNLIEYNDNLSKLTKGLEDKNFTVLLSHRPEKISEYKQYPIDLVLSGHSHGGQINLPFIGGLVAPDQGILPKYYSGLYKEDKTKMIINRGLGNSLFPQRLFNRPEIVVITLKRND
ncbi:MAG: metallophosphoesterase [Firmicutes bacterium]|nr:metallophosphoesterase [Bacillota bacterium]